MGVVDRLGPLWCLIEGLIIGVLDQWLALEVSDGKLTVLASFDIDGFKWDSGFKGSEGTKLYWIWGYMIGACLVSDEYWVEILSLFQLRKACKRS